MSSARPTNITARDPVPHLVEPQLQPWQLALFDDEGLVVEVLDNVVVVVLVDFEDDGFDGGVAGDEDAYGGGVRWGGWMRGGGGKGRGGEVPLTALGMVVVW